MDFFLNWCINCGKRSEYLYCCNECRLNDLKKKTTTLNENNYTLEFKNRSPFHSHSFYKTKNYQGKYLNNLNYVSPLLRINIQAQNNNNELVRNGSYSSTSSSNGSISDLTSISDDNTNQQMPLSIYSSPPKESNKLITTQKRPRYYIQTFHNQDINKQTQEKQVLTPLSEKDNMEYENVSNNVNSTSRMYSEENENSSHWYWSSDSDDEDDEY